MTLPIFLARAAVRVTTMARDTGLLVGMRAAPPTVRLGEGGALEPAILAGLAAIWADGPGVVNGTKTLGQLPVRST